MVPSARRHPADASSPASQDESSLLRDTNKDVEDNNMLRSAKPSQGQVGCSWCGTPFGHGYDAIAYAYRHQAQGLTAAELRDLTSPVLGATDGFSAAAFGASYKRARRRGHEGGTLLAALRGMWGRASVDIAGFEILAVVLEVAAVAYLGTVLRDYSQRDVFARPWLEEFLGEELAGHSSLRVAPLVVLAALGHWAGQRAQHRKAKAICKAQATLCSWTFRSVASSTDPASPPLTALLDELPGLVSAWAGCSWLRAVVHFVGAGLALALLVQVMGLAGFAAAPVAAVLLVAEAVAKNQWAARWKALAADLGSRREVLLKELWGSAAVVKAFGWEPQCFRRLALLRSAEREALQRAAYGTAVQAALRPELLLLLPGAACVACRTSLGYLGLEGDGEDLELWQAFTALAACHVLAEQLGRMGVAIGHPWPGEPAGKLEGTMDRLVMHANPPPQGTKSTYKASKYAVKVEGMRFYWPAGVSVDTPQPPEPAPPALPQSAPLTEREATTGGTGLDLVDEVTDEASVAERARRAQHGAQGFDLRVLSFQVKRGALVALAGATDSGKSTLLAALLGDCRSELWGDDADGSGVNLAGRVAYVPQQLQLLSGRSIKENIIGGIQFDAARYERVLKLSTLSEDVAKLPQGDASDVSVLPDNGARMCVQLARALYVEAEVMLLDDPFLSMGRERAKRVMSQCVKAMIKQRERTVVLATQRLSLLSEVDNIVVLRNGTVFEQGDYKTLVSLPTEFSRMLLISNKKDSERSQLQKRNMLGTSCPFLCYEVSGLDPLREAFPLDSEWEADGHELGGGLRTSAPSTNLWLHPQLQNPPLASARRSSQEGLKLPGSHVTGKAGGNGSEEPANAAGKPGRQGKGGKVVTRRRGFALDAPAAKKIQDFFRSQTSGSVESAPRSPSEVDRQLGDLFATRKPEAPKNPKLGNDSAWRRGRSSEITTSTDGAASSNSTNNSPSLFGGDFGLPDDGVGLYGQKPRGGLQALPQLPEMDDFALAGTTHIASESMGDSQAQQRVAPSASGVPAVGISEVDYNHQRVQAETGHWGMTTLPSVSGVDDDFPDDDMLDTSSRPLQPPDREEPRKGQPALRRDGLHGAPPRDAGPRRSEGSRSSASNSHTSDPKSGRSKASSAEERLDALERALKEKNKHIAELERQVAVTKENSDNDRKTKITQTQSGLPTPDLSAAPPVPPRGVTKTGGSCWAPAGGLLGGGGLAGVVMVAGFLATAGLHLAAQCLLGELLLAPVQPTSATAATNPTTPPSGGLTEAPASSSPTSAAPGSAGGGVWIGFGTTDLATTIAQTTSTAPATSPTTAVLPASSGQWVETRQNRFCIEGASSVASTAPAEGFILDADYGWYKRGPVTIGECKSWCEATIGWGCRFISWGRMGGGDLRWCYLHRTCPSSREQEWYEVSVLHTSQQRRRLEGRHLQALPPNQYQLLPVLVAVCCGLALAAPVQAIAATAAAATASQEASLQQLRAALAAPLHTLVDEVPKPQIGLADEQLPRRLGPLLAMLAQVLGATVGAAVACGRQAVLAVTLVLAAGLALYLHRMRLPLLSQLRRLQSEAKAAAGVCVANLAECHGVLRAHGRLEALCDEFEAICNVSVQAVISQDIAERWLCTRLFCLGTVVLGVLVFTLLGQSTEEVTAIGAAALLQAALLPAFAAAAGRHAGPVAEGLSALRQMRELQRALPAEEIESPLLRLRTRLAEASDPDGNDGGKLAQSLDLARFRSEQTASVEGFTLERVPDDWPYFGAVEFQEVTLRLYPSGHRPLHSLSLTIPPSAAVLVVGQAGTGKTSLIQAMLRLSTTEAGAVIVDNVDVRSVGLTALRSRVAYVPQEVPLFGESWRDNLDPMGEFTDEQLRLALRLTRLQNWLAQHAPKGLDEPLPAQGLDSALKALLGLTRAMLRLLQKRSKLLVMDCTTCRLSATSDADLTTLILRYCRRCEAAVLQLSQRVNQAYLYDQVAVLQGGRIVEHGPARKLWSKESALRRMAREQGVDSARMTRPQVVAERLVSMTSWDVNPQEDPEWGMRFAVNLKKPKSQGQK